MCEREDDRKIVDLDTQEATGEITLKVQQEAVGEQTGFVKQEAADENTETADRTVRISEVSCSRGPKRLSQLQPLPGNIENELRELRADDAKQHGARASAQLYSAVKPKLNMAEQREVLAEKNVVSEEAMEASGGVIKLTAKDKFHIGIVLVLSLGIVGMLCIWSKQGLLPQEHTGHVHLTKTRVGHVHAPIYTAPVTIALNTGSGSEVFDVRLIGMATKDFSVASAHRRLGGLAGVFPSLQRGHHRRLSGIVSKAFGGVTGSITYALKAKKGGKWVQFMEETVELTKEKEAEHFKTVDLGELSASGAEEYAMDVNATRSDGQPVAFMAQVLRMNGFAKHRFIIGLLIFVITFASIVAERVHRSYSAFVGASVTISVVCAVQETLHLHTITGMIDYGTLMLLFSMMILMQMLAMTGFFNWAALKVIIYSRQNPTLLFFFLTNICGFASMVLDNVTCVLLTGPLTYQISKKMQLNPRTIYLSMTICATIGGTATMIGDPPNIVIGSKLNLGFTPFLKWNLPIVAFAFMPVSSALLYYRFRNKMLLYSPENPPAKLNIEDLKEENRITDEPMFGKLGAALVAILAALLLSPVHEIEPAWFTVFAMIGCAVMFDRHHFGRFLEFVEWDTLFFFALLFVFVESLSELGVIRTLGDALVDLIKAFPEDSRMYFAVAIILWVSGIGSAFLESLPYTTTIVYIILDLMNNKDIPGVDIPTLCWPLSVGACIGGIGSIMGSSANLVCMAISARYAEKEEDKVHGSDFLKYGLPLLLVLLVIAMIWQFFLFIWLGINPAES